MSVAAEARWAVGNRKSALGDQQQGVGSKGSIDRGWQGLITGQVRRGQLAQAQSVQNQQSLLRGEKQMKEWMNEGRDE